MKTIISIFLALAVAFVTAPIEEASAQTVESGYAVKGTSNSQFLQDVQIDGATFLGDERTKSGSSVALEFRDSTKALLLSRSLDSTALDSFYLGQFHFFLVDSTLRYYDGIGWREVSRE